MPAIGTHSAVHTIGCYLILWKCLQKLDCLKVFHIVTVTPRLLVWICRCECQCSATKQVSTSNSTISVCSTESHCSLLCLCGGAGVSASAVQQSRCPSGSCRQCCACTSNASRPPTREPPRRWRAEWSSLSPTWTLLPSPQLLSWPPDAT